MAAEVLIGLCKRDTDGMVLELEDGTAVPAGELRLADVHLGSPFGGLASGCRYLVVGDGTTRVVVAQLR